MIRAKRRRLFHFTVSWFQRDPTRDVWERRTVTTCVVANKAPAGGSITYVLGQGNIADVRNPQLETWA